MSTSKVVYGLSGGASIFFGLWQHSIEAGLFLWFSLVTVWEMVAYLGENKG